MQKYFPENYDNKLSVPNTMEASTKKTYFCSESRLKPSDNESNLTQESNGGFIAPVPLNMFPRSVFSTSVFHTQEKGEKICFDTGFSYGRIYQELKEDEKKRDQSHEMKRAVECLKRTFFSNDTDAQNKSSNAKNSLLLPSNMNYIKKDPLIDNFFTERSGHNMAGDRLTNYTSENTESENTDENYSQTMSIDSWLKQTSEKDFDSRLENTCISQTDLSPCKLQEYTSTLENKMTVVLMKKADRSEEPNYLKLKSHLLKERVLTCQLITQKTISDLRAKLAEQIIESEQKWKNKICVDMETTQIYLKKISAMLLKATNEAKNEVKKNEELKENLVTEKKKKKYWKSKQRETKNNLDLKIENLKNKDEEINELQKKIKLNEDVMKNMKNRIDELSQQLLLETETKLKVLLDNKKNEEIIKKERQKLTRLKEELQKEKNLHRFSKDAYGALKEDWNILLKNFLETHLALIDSIEELNKPEFSRNNESPFFTKC